MGDKKLEFATHRNLAGPRRHLARPLEILVALSPSSPKTNRTNAGQSPFVGYPRAGT